MAPPYCSDDYVLIKQLRENYGWGAKRIKKEFPDKPWTVDGLSKVLKRLKDTGSTSRRRGSGGHNRTARTEEIIPAVLARTVSDKEAPGTHLSQRRIARELQISQTSVRNIQKKDLKLNVFKRFRVQRLTDASRDKRLSRCRQLLRRFPSEGSVRRVWFSDEKIFTVSPPVNTQNARVYGREPGVKKMDISSDRLLIESSTFSPQVMVSLAFSAMGRTRVLFVRAGAKVNKEYYTEEILTPLFADIRALCGNNWTWQQDGATSHTAAHTVAFLTENSPAFIEPTMWPPNSPDLNPLDYFLWGALVEKVYASPISDLPELKDRITQAAAEISQRSLQRAVAQWRARLRAVVANKGGQVEHLF